MSTRSTDPSALRPWLHPLDQLVVLESLGAQALAYILWTSQLLPRCLGIETAHDNVLPRWEIQSLMPRLVLARALSIGSISEGGNTIQSSSLSSFEATEAVILGAAKYAL